MTAQILPDGTIQLSSGRVLDPNCGVVGVNHKLEVYEGYDSSWIRYFTADEKRELADVMLARWQAYRAQA